MAIGDSSESVNEPAGDQRGQEHRADVHADDEADGTQAVVVSRMCTGVVAMMATIAIWVTTMMVAPSVTPEA